MKAPTSWFSQVRSLSEKQSGKGIYYLSDEVGRQLLTDLSLYTQDLDELKKLLNSIFLIQWASRKKEKGSLVYPNSYVTTNRPVTEQISINSFIAEAFKVSPKNLSLLKETLRFLVEAQKKNIPLIYGVYMVEIARATQEERKVDFADLQPHLLKHPGIALAYRDEDAT